MNSGVIKTVAGSGALSVSGQRLNITGQDEVILNCPCRVKY